MTPSKISESYLNTMGCDAKYNRTHLHLIQNFILLCVLFLCYNFSQHLNEINKKKKTALKVRSYQSSCFFARFGPEMSLL